MRGYVNRFTDKHWCQWRHQSGSKLECNKFKTKASFWLRYHLAWKTPFLLAL